LGNYRSSYSTSSSSATGSTSRYNYGGDTSSSYRSYRSSLTGSTALTGGRDTQPSYRNYTNDDSSKSSLSTRIGVSSDKDSTSNYRSRYNRISVDKDTKSSLSSLPPITSSSLPPPSPFLKKRASITRDTHQSSEQNSNNSNAGAQSKSSSNSINLANDLDSMYEKYSPSRYRSKYEYTGRSSRSLSDAAPATNNKSNDDYISNKSSTYTPKSEVNYSIFIFLHAFFI
jgi:hypothetical protein